MLVHLGSNGIRSSGDAEGDCDRPAESPQERSLRARLPENRSAESRVLCFRELIPKLTVMQRGWAEEVAYAYGSPQTDW
jgi:hypothetical protein